jgi:hypothetical protein
MPLPGEPNASVTIYRNFSASNPYPADGTRPSAKDVPGVLKHHMKNGRFGRGMAAGAQLFWTHLLYLEDTVDIRSAYDSQLRAADPTRADTVLIGDYPIPGKC